MEEKVETPAASSEDTMTVSFDAPAETGEAHVEKQGEATAPEEPASKESESKEDKAAPAPDEKKPLKGVEKRINELTRQKREEAEARRIAELEAAELRGRLKERESSGIERTAQNLTVKGDFPDAEPDEVDYSSTRDFIRAHEEWSFNRREWARAQATKQKQEEERQKSVNEKIAAQRERGYEKYDDFEEVVRKIPPLYLGTIDFMAESDVGEDISYYLGNNPEELKRIASLPLHRQIAEAALIEQKFKAGVVINQKSDAPPPPSTLRAGAASVEDARYLDPRLSTAERIALSRKRQAERMGAR